MSFTKKFTATLLLALSVSLSAAEIRELEVVDANGKKLSNEFVLNNIRSKPGSEFNARTMAQDIKRLYKSNRYNDIDIEFNEANGTLKVTVSLKPVVTKIRFEGNKALDNDDLESKVKHGLNVVVDDLQLSQDKAAIKKLYDGEGFYNAQVLVETRKLEVTGEVEIVFSIVENLSRQVDKVLIHGNTVFDDGEIRDMMKTEPSMWRAFFDTGFYNENIFNLDKESISRAYKRRGYLDFRIEDVKLITDEDGYLTIDMTFYEGLPYIIGKISYAGNTVYKTEKLKELTALAGAQVYNTDVIESDVNRFVDKYSGNGYLDFNCYPQLKPNTETHEVDVEYRIIEGSTSIINDVIIVNNLDTKEHVIRRELAIHPGDLGSRILLNKSKTRLQNMGYFKTVSINAVDTGIKGEKDIIVRVEEQNTGKIGFGVGFSSADSFLLSLNLSQPNFDWDAGWPYKGGGQRIFVSGSLGGQYQNFSVNFVEPWLFDKPLSLGVGVFHNNRFWEDYDQTNTGYNIALSKRMESFPLWTISHGHRLENVKLSVDNDASPELHDEETTDIVSAYTLTLKKDTRNSLRRPTAGRVMSLSLELQSSIIASANNMFKLQGRWTEYSPIFEESAFKLEAKFGIAEGLDDVPIYERWFGGGIGRIRGYEERHLGPMDSQEDPLGGSSYLYLTAELDTPLRKNFNGVLFVDAGNVWDNASDLVNPFDMSVTVGGGLRINLPIGLVELYYGIPVIDNSENGSSGRLHFNLGYGF